MAPGHSARVLYEKLLDKGVCLEPKPIAVRYPLESSFHLIFFIFFLLYRRFYFSHLLSFSLYSSYLHPSHHHYLYVLLPSFITFFFVTFFSLYFLLYFSLFLSSPFPYFLLSLFSPALFSFLSLFFSPLLSSPFLSGWIPS